MRARNTSKIQSKNIFLFFGFAAFFLMFFPHFIFAASPIRIIEPAELETQFSSFTILDARSKRDFIQEHIPGSQHVHWRQWAQNRFLPTGLLQDGSPKLEQTLEKLGLSNSKPIVIVGEPHGWGEEGRIAWSLLYWGAQDVRLLNGGFPAWKKIFESLIEKGPSIPPSLGHFSIEIQPERRASKEQVLETLTNQDRRIFDVRSKEEFSGKKKFGQKRGGHLPGSIFVEAQTLYRYDGTYALPDELRRLVPNGDLRNGIAYCVGGVRSALFAMLWEACFGDMIANYDGSMWEWSRDENLPIKK